MELTEQEERAIFSNFGDVDFMRMDGTARSSTENPDGDAFYQGAFTGYSILVILCSISEFTTAEFHQQCGAALKEKGFDYNVAETYEAAITQLCRVNGEGRCPFSQAWLYSYLTVAGPKLDQMIDALVDFQQKGGGLLIWGENEPCNTENNALLRKLTFTEGGKTGPTAVRINLNDPGQTQIKCATSTQPTVGCFNPSNALPPPGRARTRFTLRPGLVESYEGITVGIAVNESKTPLTTPEELWPFTPFAYTSTAGSGGNPHPYILYYDPKIPPDAYNQFDARYKDAKVSPGPIVLHGGWTSCTPRYNTDVKGMGRLIKSCAVWLTRFEERTYMSRLVGRTVTTTPPLTKTYS